jgi:predicted PurR-regulated permease PerM
MNSTFYRRCFALATIAILGYALIRIVHPFLGALIWGVFLAFLLFPLHRWLTRRLGGRVRTSAALLTAATPIAILVPISLIATTFAAQSAALAERIRALVTDPSAIQASSLARYPVVGPVVDWLEERGGVTEERVREWALSSGEVVLKWAAGFGRDFVLGAFSTVFAFLIAIALVYIVLTNGETWVRRPIRLIPMEPAKRDRLIRHLADVTRAIVIGTGVTAVIQGIATGIGFAIAGLPSFVVYGVLAGLLSLLPIGGAALVWVPGVIYLAAVSRWGMALFLLLWGIVISSADNLLRPVLISRHAEISDVTVFFGVLGGIAAFGAIGLVLGPLVLALIHALLDYVEETQPPKA